MGGAKGGVATGPCDDGAERECGYQLEQDGEVLSCYRGVQSCDSDGQWSECGSGEVITLPAPEPTSLRAFARRYDPQTLSGAAAAACSPTDLCDPYCYELAEGTGSFSAGTLGVRPDMCDTATHPSQCTAIAGCEHSLCTTGVGLTNSSALCGTCATSVCTALPSCCGSSGSWTATCVNKAMALCNGSAPPLGLCDFGVFSESSLTLADRAGLGGATVGGNGNFNFGTNSPTKFPGRLLLKGDLWVRSPNSAGPVSSELWISGSVGIESGSGPTVWNMDVHSGEGMYLFGNNTVTGSVYTSTDYANSAPSAQPSPAPSPNYNLAGQNNTARVTTGYASALAEIQPTGTALVVTNRNVNPFAPLTPASIVMPVAIPGLPAPCASGTCPGGTAYAPALNADTPALAPGNYGAVTVTGTGKVLLTGSGAAPYVYTFKSLSQNGAGGIKLGTASGQYVIIVEGKFAFGGTGSNVLDSTGAVLTDRTRLVVHVGATDTASPCSGTACAAYLVDNARFVGVVSAPNGTAFMGNTVAVNGAVWGARLESYPDFTLTTITPAECASMNLAGTSTPSFTCPTALDGGVTIAIPALLPSDVTNSTASLTKCRWGADCQANQRCVDVESGNDSIACLNFDKCSTSVSTVPSYCKQTTSPLGDVCVRRIIAKYPSCGNAGGWDATCVGYVQTECDATCSPSGSRAGTCVSNDGAAAEAGCSGTNGYDLAVDYVCTAGVIPVCNHGATDFSGNLTLHWWDTSDRQFATTAPNTALKDGSLVTTAAVTITAGECLEISSANATQTGTMAVTSSYTVMADPSWALSECNSASAGGNDSRRLDNWSWHDGTVAASACTPAADYVEYEYVADCSAVPGSSARWKNLSWAATLAGVEQVEFQAKVGTSVAALASATYTSVAVDTGTDATYVNCATGAMCARSLTTALSLPTATQQGQALSIRVEKTIGLPATNLSWEVSYSCEYDQ